MYIDFSVYFIKIHIYLISANQSSIFYLTISRFNYLSNFYDTKIKLLYKSISQTHLHHSQNNTAPIASSQSFFMKASLPLFNPKQYLKSTLTQEEIKEIKTTFDIFDSKGQGYINPKQLIEALDSINYRFKQNAIYQYILDLAADGQGVITFETFLTMMTTRVTEDDSREDMIQLFSLFDDEKCGYLTIKSLRRMVREMKIDVTEEELQKMIEIADFDRDGRVSEQQFYLFMVTKKGN